MSRQNGNTTKKTLARLLAAVMVVSLVIGMLPATAFAAASNKASFTGSAIPASMIAGQSYTVKITVKNTGSATWTPAAGYKLVCTSGASTFMNKTSYTLPCSVKPNASVTFTVAMTAPLKKGKFTSSWKMSKGRAKFGGTLSKRVSVTVPASNSLCAAASFPSSLTLSDTGYTLPVTFKNTGSARWTSKAGYSLSVTFTVTNPALGVLANETFSIPLLAKDSIAFRASKKFTIPKEYSVFPIDGVYTYKMQMACKGKKFGQIITKKITVKMTNSQIDDFVSMLLAEESVLLQMNDYTDAQQIVAIAQNYVNQLPNGSDRTNLQNKVNSAKAVLKAINEINALPSPDQLKLADKPAVKKARADYDALSAGEKAQVPNLSTLAAAEDKIAALDKAEAQKVITEIGALPAAGTLTLANKPSVQQARTDYDALSADQKALVTNDSALTAAERKIADLEAAALYDAAVAQVPADNASGTYTADSWTAFSAAIAGCNLRLTAADGQAALDAETAKIQSALVLLALS